MTISKELALGILVALVLAVVIGIAIHKRRNPSGRGVKR